MGSKRVGHDWVTRHRTTYMLRFCLYFLLLFSHTVMSNSLQPHELQHTRPLCPSPSPQVCPSSCSLHQWCCPAISSYDTVFSLFSQYPSAFIITYLYFFNRFFYVSLPLILLPLNPSSAQLSTTAITALQCQRNQRSNWQHLLDYRKGKGIPKRKKNLLLLHWLHQSPWLCGSQLWKILKDTGVPDHLTCLLSKLYAGQEAAVSARHGTKEWFKIGKGVTSRLYILLLYLFNFYIRRRVYHFTEYIGWNAGLDDSQAGIKIAGRHINNLRYADDITLMA